MQRNLVSLDVARWRLAIVWFCVGGAVFVVLAIQSMAGLYGSRVQAVWSWALPNFVPTLALMISVFAADALRPYAESAETKVRLQFFKLSFALSVFYLACLLLTILMHPFILTWSVNRNQTQLDLLEMSNLWLAPLQGLVVAAIGVLFFLKEDDKRKPGQSDNEKRSE
jgi:hypothetical protein